MIERLTLFYNYSNIFKDGTIKICEKNDKKSKLRIKKMHLSITKKTDFRLKNVFLGCLFTHATLVSWF